jgi:hypothetical protein
MFALLVSAARRVVREHVCACLCRHLSRVDLSVSEGVRVFVRIFLYVRVCLYVYVAISGYAKFRYVV